MERECLSYGRIKSGTVKYSVLYVCSSDATLLGGGPPYRPALRLLRQQIACDLPRPLNAEC
jgi:hypothetical protein